MKCVPIINIYDSKNISFLMTDKFRVPFYTVRILYSLSIAKYFNEGLFAKIWKTKRFKKTKYFYNFRKSIVLFNSCTMYILGLLDTCYLLYAFIFFSYFLPDPMSLFLCLLKKKFLTFTFSTYNISIDIDE